MGSRDEYREAAVAIVGEEYCDRNTDRQLTVRKTCLFFPGDGFAVYERLHGGGDVDDVEREEEKVGELVFRVENYGSAPPCLPPQRKPNVGSLVLMGPHGQCILSVRRKRPSLHRRWEGFLYDNGSSGGGGKVGLKDEEHRHQEPIFSIRRSSIIRRLGSGGCDSFHVEVYTQQNDHNSKPPELFRVEGSFPSRCCTIYAGGDGADGNGDSCESVNVAEIVRKVDASTNVMLGRDVFCLRLRRGFDAAFAMGLVLALDQITSDDDGDDDDEDSVS